MDSSHPSADVAACASLQAKRAQLLDTIRCYGRAVVAFSGGVDSAVVAKAAQFALGDEALAVTGVSASLASGELDQAVELARLIGIRHEVLRTDEFSRSDYVQNAPDRCYHCKSELYAQLDALAAKHGNAAILNGANSDDAADYRPGMIAAGEHRVRSPLADCGLTKNDVRQLAQEWRLPVWDKPATPCLSSRVAYGEEVTPARLRMIDQAEAFLRLQDLGLLRVRYHRGDVARIEVPVTELSRLCEPGLRDELLATFKSLGFKYVTLDLEGFRSGSQNQVLPLEILSNARP